MSKNTFSISGDKIYITRPEWNYMAYATLRDDYAEEIQNATATSSEFHKMLVKDLYCPLIS